MKRKTKNNNPISTKLVYLDLEFILEHYKDPGFWGKEWTIFKSGNIEIYWTMTDIKTKSRLIESEIHVRSFKKGRSPHFKVWQDAAYRAWYCRAIPIKHEEYTQETFKRNIFSAIIAQIGEVEKTLIQQYAEYRHAERLEAEELETLEEIAEQVANEYVTGCGEYAETAKEAIIHDYISDRRPNYTSGILRSYDHKVLGSLYLMVCSWFGYEQEFENHRALVNNKQKHVWLDMFKRAKEIQTDEWRNAMAEEFKATLE